MSETVFAPHTTVVAYVAVPNGHEEAPDILNHIAEEFTDIVGAVYVSEGMGLWVDPKTLDIEEDSHVVRYEASLEGRLANVEHQLEVIAHMLEWNGAKLDQVAVFMTAHEGVGALVYT